MILMIIFSLLLYAVLWPYYILTGVLDFKHRSTDMEPALPGRPARRTIGRKNADVIKAITSMYVGYFIFALGFYGFPQVRDLIGETSLIAFVVFVVTASVYIITPLNRLAHAYMSLGKVAVSHFVCAISAYHIVVSIFYDNTIPMAGMGIVSLMVLGAMLCFSLNEAKDAKKNRG